MQQIAATFGFEHVVGLALPWDEVEPDKCRFSFVIGNSVVPPVPAFGDRSVYHIQFPFWVPDADVEARGEWLGGYDEIWVYSEFVRRNVNGLVRHYGLEAPPIRRIHAHATWSGATSGLPWPERRTILTVGRFFTGGHNKRQDVVIEAFRRIVDEASTAWSWPSPVHPPSPEGRRRFHELQRMAAGLDCTFYPNIGRMIWLRSTNDRPC